MTHSDDGRRSLRVPAFWQALLVVVGAYLLFAYAFPPLMPRSLMIQFMIITVVGVLLYFSFDEERWAEFKAPIQAAMGEQRLWPVRWSLLLLVPALVGYVVYDAVTPSLQPPVELRQVHPAPPSKLKVYGRSYDLTSLENPVRTRILEQRRSDAEVAGQAYRDAVAAGSEVFYQNCLYCHGDLLNGGGPFARAFNPLPANFQDVGTIAQLQEAYVFWRITTGGPGLPREGGTWNSAMPVWSEMLSEDEVWNVITFLYDYVGQVPRMWDQETSKAVSGMQDDTERGRRQMSAGDLYQFRCAACHGDTGAGDGPAADFLYPRPRDFTLGLFKYKSSPGELPPRDDDLFDTIKNGLRSTGMPAWRTLLSDAQIRSLIPIIKSFDVTATWAPEDAPDEAFDDEGRYTRKDFTLVTAQEPLDGQVAYTPESIARGEKVFDKVCKKCHGRRGRGNITSGKRLEDDWGARIWPRDLTKPWSWRVSNVAGDDDAARRKTIGNIYSRLSIGIPGTPMPRQRAVEEGNEDPVSLADRWHVANYVYSLREQAAPPPSDGALIIAARVDGALPDTGSDPAWEQARPVTIRLAPNIIKEERLFTPLSDAVSVRALYDDNEVAFLLEIDDRTDSRRGDQTSEQIQDESLEMYADAAAIQFPVEDAYVVSPVVVKPLFRHGDAARNTTIWYWNAGSIDPPVAPRATLLDGTGPDQKLAPRSGDTDLSASGVWQDGRWRIVMRRPRDGTPNGDVSFQEGKFIPVSFASWDGSNGEVGARHTLSTWYWLLFPSQPNLAASYGLPTGSAALVFVAGLMLVRRQRRGARHGERTEPDDG